MQKQRLTTLQRLALYNDRRCLLMDARLAHTRVRLLLLSSQCKSARISGHIRHEVSDLHQIYSLRRSILGLVCGFYAQVLLGLSSSHESSNARLA